MKKIITFTLAAALLVLPQASSAATYAYISMNGTVKAVDAANPYDALAQADATGEVLHSGVMADQGMLDVGDVYGSVYTYADINGNFKNVVAASMDAATLLAASDIAPQSGFIISGMPMPR